MQSAGQAAPAKPTFVVGAQVPPCCPRLEPVAQQEWKTRVGRPEAAVGSLCRMQRRLNPGVAPGSPSPVAGRHAYSLHPLIDLLDVSCGQLRRAQGGVLEGKQGAV